VNNYNYLVPANTKKQGLMFGFMTPTDLIIAIVGASITFILLMIFQPKTLGLGILVVLPFIIAAFLVFPIPNYHNVRVLIMEIYNFYSGRRKYIWRGWCYQYEQSDDE
jgi:hypothetical protein